MTTATFRAGEGDSLQGDHEALVHIVVDGLADLFVDDDPALARHNVRVVESFDDLAVGEAGVMLSDRAKAVYDV